MMYFNEKTASQLTLVAIFQAKEGKAAMLKELLLGLIDVTRAEEGSVSYHLYEDRDRPGCFIFHETWATTALWEKHMERAHIKDFFTKSPSLLAGEPVLQQWERSEAPEPVIDKDALVLFAYNRSKAGKEKKWQEILEDLIQPTLAEKGALHYELHRSKNDPRDFMFHETWQTVESWNDHMEAAHLKALLEIIGDYTENGITVVKARAID